VKIVKQVLTVLFISWIALEVSAIIVMTHDANRGNYDVRRHVIVRVAMKLNPVSYI
jgi:hypothetical protein